MRKFLLAGALALSALPLIAQQGTPDAVVAGTPNHFGGYVDFRPITSPVVGKPTERIDLRQYLFRTHTVQIDLIGAAPSACTGQLEGSSNGYNWYSISGSQSCVAGIQFSVDQRPERFLRFNILTWTGTAGLNVSYTGAN